MGPLEEEVQNLMQAHTNLSPAAARARFEGPQPIDASMIGDLILPMLTGHREAILRIAREIDQSRA
jgi:hypothetical protein